MYGRITTDGDAALSALLSAIAVEGDRDTGA
jgi:hypothetical protein